MGTLNNAEPGQYDKNAEQQEQVKSQQKGRINNKGLTHDKSKYSSSIMLYF